MSDFKRLKMDPDASVVKWACDYCTYENYPSSLKCVMCRAPKRTQYIQDAALIQPHSSSSSSPQNQDQLDNFLNLADSAHSQQQLQQQRQHHQQQQHQDEQRRKSPHNRQATGGGGNSGITEIGSSVSSSIDCSSAGVSPSGGVGGVSTPSSSSSSGCITSSSASTSSSSTSSCNPAHKWPCKACTYLNWPKANKCNQCLTPRGQELSPTYYKQVEREVKDAARFGISKDVDPGEFAVKSSSKEPSPGSEKSRSQSPPPLQIDNNNTKPASTKSASTTTTTTITAETFDHPAITTTTTLTTTTSPAAKTATSIRETRSSTNTSPSTTATDAKNVVGDKDDDVDDDEVSRDIGGRGTKTRDKSIVRTAAAKSPSKRRETEGEGGHDANDDDDANTSRVESLSLSSYRIQETPNQLPSTTSHSLSSLLNKWSCLVCTYENWPRTQKCAMCFTPRGKKAPPADAEDFDDGLESNLNHFSSQNVKARSDNSSSSSLMPLSPRASSESRTKDENLRNFVLSHSKPNQQINRGRRGSPGPGSPGSISPRSSESDSGARMSTSGIGANARASGIPAEISGSGGHRGSNNSLSGGAAAASSATTTTPTTPDNRKIERESREIDRRLRHARKHGNLPDVDWLFLRAFLGALENELDAVDAFLAAGGDRDRLLTEDDCALLGRPSAFTPGTSLIQVAVRFQSEDVLALLLTSEMEAQTIKRMPSHISPDIAADILKHVSMTLRQKKGPFGCYFVSDCVTFSWPAEVDDLPITVQQKLFDEVLDKDVQSELDADIINWSLELTTRLGSRLYALWNRTSGNCLLDSILQATYGVFDRDNTMRRALGDTLHEAGHAFFPRWREYEMRQAASLQFSLDESQLQQDWAILLSLASQPGASLEQLHIFALAHILRRPIIVYGVRYVKNFRGDNIGLARFQGIYVPFLWDQSFCWKTPVAMGYTRGHFCALVPMEESMDRNQDSNRYGAIASRLNMDENRGTGLTGGGDHVAYLPLVDRDGKRLPVHFMTHSEMGREDAIIREWLDCRVTESGILVAIQRLLPRPPLQRHLLDEWMNHYRSLPSALAAVSLHGRSNLHLPSASTYPLPIPSPQSHHLSSNVASPSHSTGIYTLASSPAVPTPVRFPASTLIAPSTQHHVQHQNARNFHHNTSSKNHHNQHHHHHHHHRPHLSSCTTPPPTAPAVTSGGLHLESSDDETDDE